MNKLKNKGMAALLAELFRKPRGKDLLKGLLLVLGSAVLGTALLAACSLIPAERLQQHLVESAELMQEETLYQKITPLCTSQLDNFTDSIMLKTAADDTKDTPLRRAMMAYSGTISGMDAYSSLIAHYVQGQPYEGSSGYYRYWHGYQIWLRPLLFLMNYRILRKVNRMVQALLCLLVCVLLFRRKKRAAAFAYGMAYLMLMPLALGKSLQFSCCYYLYTIGSLILLCMSEEQRKRNAGFVFLGLGIALAYFDLLTYPAAVFGIPALVCLVLDPADTPEMQTGRMIRQGVCWAAGYAGMWSLKWVLAAWITGENALTNAANEAAFWTSHSGKQEGLSVRICLQQNIQAFFDTPVRYLAAAFLAVAVFWAWKKGVFRQNGWVLRLMPYAAAACVPLLWYLLLTNHSMWHSWFTNKACVVLFLAGTLAAASWIDDPVPSEK